MKNVIAINGTPGTGKTSLAQKLTEFQVWNLNDFAKRHPEIIVEFDDNCQCDIIDEELLTIKLQTALESINEVIIIESHLADLIPKEYLLHCYVLEAAIPDLVVRLQQRDYPIEKIEENKLAEIMKECFVASINAFGAERVTLVPPKSLDETLMFVSTDIKLRLDAHDK